MYKTYTTLRALLARVLVCLLCVAAPVSCTDEFLPGDIAPGDGSIGMTVSYYPNVTTDVQTRAAGNAMENLRSLAVVIFTEDGELYDLLDESRLPGLNKELTHTDRPGMSEEDAKNKGSWTEGSQKRATFRLEGLPFGRYKIYCVANKTITRDMIAFSTDPAKREQEEKAYETEEGKLRSLPLEWNPQNIASNDAMFGYFTIFDEKSTDMPLSRNNAEVVEIDRTDIRLHAWLKRAASKVTVAFDPSGLHQNVSIFIHKVTIKDIPRTCFLGKDNSPVAEKLEERDAVLFADGETIYYNARGEEVDKDPGSGDDNHLLWMEINNGTPTRGSKHGAADKSLFFFENMQGDYEGHEKKESYNKEPKAGWVHEYLKRPEADWDRTPWDYDTKDKVLAGTYIEVEGFYESTNDLNTTNGPIKYRFMLGKNTTYNYNAQRNHHYKVTLKFKGWANQPEWHVEYIEEKPDVDVVDYLFMPYVYHEMTTLPIRFNGNIKTLDVEILENDWAPYVYDDEKRRIDLAPDHDSPEQSKGSLTEVDNTFKWNKPAWLLRNGISSEEKPVTVSGGKNMQHLGFLALTMPINPPANILDNKAYSGGGETDDGHKITGDDILDSLKQIYYALEYEGLPQNKRSFTEADLTEGEHGKKETAEDQSELYTVYKDGNATTVLMPLFTRAKSMISAAGWSGNNPYEYHSRVAKLEVKATFSRKNKEDTVLTRYVRVIQRPRITNPKAIWRKVGNTKDFKVKMMTRKSDALDADYTPFKSNGSWTAEIEVNGGNNNFTLEPGPNCEYEKDEKGVVNRNKLIGKTNTEMEFTIGFGGKVACGIINVRYHAEKCTHRIFVRQGDDPIQISDGGATWLSKNLQHGGSGGYNYTTTASASTGGTLVDTPLSFGSYFKRGQLSQGIDESNNDKFSFLQGINPTGTTPEVLLLGNKTSSARWRDIPCKRFVNSTSNTNYTPNYTWRDVVVSGTTCSLPEYNDFKHLTDNSEFGFGILYGDDATETKENFVEATGYAAMWNDKTVSYGVRAVIAYNKENGNQVYFPLSASGYGRRNQAFVNYANRANAGRLLYGDTDYRLTNYRWSTTTGIYELTNNIYRPIPYNLPYNSGAIYWIKKINLKGHYEAGDYYPCAAWDINYFNFDFGPYTANCLTFTGGNATSWHIGSDALPIRLVSKHQTAIK